MGLLLSISSACGSQIYQYIPKMHVLQKYTTEYCNLARHLFYPTSPSLLPTPIINVLRVSPFFYCACLLLG